MAGQLILVVDDNDVNCLVAESMLKILGYSTRVAKSGEEAISLANQVKFDLILMDWQMPVLNGFETAEKIWNESLYNKATKMIAVTANAFHDDQKTCLNHGFRGVLTKPFDVDQLSTILIENLQ